MKSRKARSGVSPLKLWPVKQMDVCKPVNGLVPSVQKKKRKNERKSSRRAMPAGSFLFFSSLLEGMRKQPVAGLLLLKTHFVLWMCVRGPRHGGYRVGACQSVSCVTSSCSSHNLGGEFEGISQRFLPRRTYELTALLHSHPLTFYRPFCFHLRTLVPLKDTGSILLSVLRAFAVICV